MISQLHCRQPAFGQRGCSQTSKHVTGALAPIHTQHRRAVTVSTQATRRDTNAAFSAGITALVLQLLQSEDVSAITSNPLEFRKEMKNRRRKIPESEYTDGPDGIKFYELNVGSGQEAKVGDRVAVHFDVKFRNVTFATSRQGVGVTGGTPLGFDVGQPPGAAGSTLRGIDIGVRGMRVGGLRKLIVPPELAYGTRGFGEIPPNATLQIDLELLSIKNSPYGYRTKLVEG